jgi:3-oxoacyl-[acyl-carrier protein] reductase
MTFKDKVVLVTGGSSGIGEAVSRKFATAGAKVAVVASRDLTKANNVTSKLKDAGLRALPYVADVSSVNEVNSLVDSIQSDMGEIDILINCAGVYFQTPIGETSKADMDSIIDVNLKGTFNMINKVGPFMKKKRGGKIVNISSVAAVIGINTFSLYCATKAAIAMLTRSLSIELAPYDINVVALGPGNTTTPLNEAFRTDPKHQTYLEGMKERTPSNTMFSEPDEMADIVLFLASDAARPIHGSFILADEAISAGL